MESSVLPRSRSWTRPARGSDGIASSLPSSRERRPASPSGVRASGPRPWPWRGPRGCARRSSRSQSSRPWREADRVDPDVAAPRRRASLGVKVAVQVNAAIRNPAERHVCQRDRRVGSAERGRDLVAETHLLEGGAVAEVVVAEDQEAASRTVPQPRDEGVVLERGRVRHVAEAYDGVAGRDVVGPGLEHAAFHRAQARERSAPSPRTPPGPGGGGRTRSTSRPGAPR